jgi:hypothetical protein
MLYCSDEKQGFERFFQLLEEFQKLDPGVNPNAVEEKEVLSRHVLK